jgi:predicted AAA+ superfamily ATPase
MELLRRGYTVRVGEVGEREIDFIAVKSDMKAYFQVAYILANAKVIDREFNVFSQISDNFPKYVLSMDKNDFSQGGIIHSNLLDWLLG